MATWQWAKGNLNQTRILSNCLEPWQIGLWHFPQLDTVQQPVPARRGSSGCRLGGATRNATRHPTDVVFFGQGFERLQALVIKKGTAQYSEFVSSWKFPMSSGCPKDCHLIDVTFLGQFYDHKINEKWAGLAPLGRGPAIPHAARCDLL